MSRCTVKGFPPVIIFRTLKCFFKFFDIIILMINVIINDLFFKSFKVEKNVLYTFSQRFCITG
jgi:hypothetical protein